MAVPGMVYAAIYREEGSCRCADGIEVIDVPSQAERPSYDPQALLDAQPVIIAVIDPDTYRVQFQNETGLQKFGDISGEVCHEKIAGCPIPCSFCKMPEAVSTGLITINEVALPNDQHLLVQWSKAVTADGRTHVIETITDVTKQKRMEEAARQAEKMDALGRLAGGIAHDFNNLLTIINGHSEHLLRQVDENDSRSNIREIQEAVERAARLTQHLVAFSHHQVLQPTIQDLNALVTDMEPVLRELLDARIELSIALEADAGQIVTDRQQLEQVILNLVANAKDAMPQGGRLRIATTHGAILDAMAFQHNARPGTYVQLAVSDNGVGIDEETQAHLFEPFFKRKGLHIGSGLGLAKVYGIIRQSGGFIELRSELNRGSTFTIFLPRCETIPPAEAADRRQEPLRGPTTILVVEDDADVRLVVGDMLRAQGYQVSEACDGVHALQIIKNARDPVHMVLTDIMMPRMTGPELVRRLETLCTPVKVLYMSGYTDEILEPAMGQRLGFIQKPFTSKVLLKKVCETLEIA